MLQWETVVVALVQGGCWGFLGLGAGCEFAFPRMLPLFLSHRLSPAMVRACLSVDTGPPGSGKITLDLQVEVISLNWVFEEIGRNGETG